MYQYPFKRPASAEGITKNNKSSNFQNKNILPEKPKTPIQKYANRNYTNNVNLKQYWEKKNKKSQQKIESIKRERYEKEYGEIRKTPKIDQNSQKIINRLLNEQKRFSQNNSNYNNITTQNNNKSFLTDYNDLYYNRKINTQLNSRPQTAKKPIRPLITEIKYKPIIKNESDYFHGYLMYDQEKVNDVRNKFHNYLNSQYQNRRNDEFSKISENYYNYRDNKSSSKSVNIPSEYINNQSKIQRIVPSYNKIINNNNSNEFTNNQNEKKNSQNYKNNNNKKKEINNNVINQKYKINQKDITSNYSTNKNSMKSFPQNIGSTMPTSNRGNQYQSYFNKPSKTYEINNNNFNINEYNNSRGNTRIILEQNNKNNNNNSTINRRTDDLKKFMLFTENLNVPIYNEKKNKNNNKKNNYQSNNNNNQQITFHNPKTLNSKIKNQQSSILKKSKELSVPNPEMPNSDINIQNNKVNYKYKENHNIEYNENNFPKKLTKEMILSNGFVINEINKDNFIQSYGHQNNMKLNNNSKNFLEERIAHLGTKIKKNN